MEGVNMDGDFDLFLPRVVDASGLFLEEDAADFSSPGPGLTLHSADSFSASLGFDLRLAGGATTASTAAGAGGGAAAANSNGGFVPSTAATTASSAPATKKARTTTPKQPKNEARGSAINAAVAPSSKRMAVPLGKGLMSPSSASSTNKNKGGGGASSGSNGGMGTAGQQQQHQQMMMLMSTGNVGGSANGSGSSEEDEEGGAGGAAGGEDDGSKKTKRRKQIAAASRASRARRKRELDDLREENRRLREERSQFLSKIGELQMKVEALRERGSTDMRIENELLRAQLEEHKRFVGCFKRLCDGAPTSLNARHAIYKQGSDAAQAHVLSLISQAQADDWSEAIAPEGYNIPYQNFCMHYKFKSDFGEKEPSEGASASPGLGVAAPDSSSGGGRKRLNVRVDVLFPAMDAAQVAEFFWNSFSNTDVQTKLYGVKGVELTQLADDMPDKDTKMIYYREKHAPPKRDVDWVIICNRRKRDLAKSTLAVPNRKVAAKPQLGRASAIVMAMSTTQHSVAPQFDNADRITSMFVQGCVTWNVGGDCRACVVFSFPDDFRIKAIEGFHDVVDDHGVVSSKFISILRSFNELLGEHASESVADPSLLL